MLTVFKLVLLLVVGLLEASEDQHARPKEGPPEMARPQDEPPEDLQVEDAIQQIFQDALINPGDIKITDSSYIHTSIILSNVVRPEDGSLPPILSKFQVFCRSLLSHSTGYRLHLMFTTDEQSIPDIKSILMQEIGRSLAYNVFEIPSMSGFGEYKWKFPSSLKVEFVNLAYFSETFKQPIDEMRKYFGVVEKGWRIGADGTKYWMDNPKYQKDLFYIAPHYPAAFPPELNYVIVLDVDLEFRIDLVELLQYFKQMEDREMIGLAPDLTPHYYFMTKYFRKHAPDTKVGQPGKMQGFNTGVALYNLEKMRLCTELKDALTETYFKYLVNKYKFFGGVGDQEFFTMFGWEYPELFYSLPCEYNLQTFMDPTVSEEYREKMPSYRNCTNNPKIIHRNGSI